MFRKDKDKYITFIYENVRKGLRVEPFSLFLYGADTTKPFDFQSPDSIDPKKLAKTNKITYHAIGDPQNKLKVGPRENFTVLNFVEINKKYKCQTKCSTPLGVAFNGKVPDANLKASSCYKHFTALNGRLHGCTAWCAKEVHRKLDYLQIDLGRPTSVCSIFMQGNANDELDAMVLYFTVQYSIDSKNWQNVNEVNDPSRQKMFKNEVSNKLAVARHKLPTVINARYVRITPRSSNVRPCMRVELIGDPKPTETSWTPWTPCHAINCTQERQRFCGYIDRNKKTCPNAAENGVESETRKCQSPECKGNIDGEWSDWSYWGYCKLHSCGTGKHNRTRKCIYPDPKRKGAPCLGKSVEEKKCRSKLCGLGDYGCSFTSYYTCNWTFDPTSQFEWEVVRKQDHTSPKGQEGFYITFNHHRKSVKQFSDFRSPILDSSSTPRRCFGFYYFLLKKANASVGDYIEAFAEDPYTGRKIKTIATNLPATQSETSWTRKQYDLDIKQKFRVVFRAHNGDFKFGIDDVQLSIGPSCYSPPANQKEIHVAEIDDTCHFDHGLCNWKHVYQAGFVNISWTQRKGETPTPQTGPLDDHTSSQGSYLYIDSSKKVNHLKDRARLVSKTYNKNYKCMAIWLNTNGAHLWQVNIYKKTASFTSRVFETHLNTRNRWWKALVDLKGTQDFQIIIEGLVGFGPLGDIAIDDVTVSTKECKTTDIAKVYPDFYWYFQERKRLQPAFDVFDLPGKYYFKTMISTDPLVFNRFTFVANHVRVGDKAVLVFDKLKGCKLQFYAHFFNPPQHSALKVYGITSLDPAKRILLKTVKNADPKRLESVRLQEKDNIQQVLFEGVALKPGDIKIHLSSIASRLSGKC